MKRYCYHYNIDIKIRDYETSLDQFVILPFRIDSDERYQEFIERAKEVFLSEMKLKGFQDVNLSEIRSYSVKSLTFLHEIEA